MVPFPQNLKILYLICFTLAALGVFFYLRLLNVTSWVALWGAFFFIFSGHFISQISDFASLQAISFLPWVFWQTHKLILRPKMKKIILLGLILALQLLSGPIGTALLTWLLAFSYTLVLSLFDFGAFTSRAKNEFLQIGLLVSHFLLSLFISLVLSAIKLLPLKELGAFEEHTLTFFFAWSYPLKALVSFLNPFAKVKFSLFIGTFPFLSLIIVFVFFQKQLRKIFLLLLFNILACLGCFLLAIPRHSPFYIFYLFPPFNLTETPLVFISLSIWFLTVALVFLLNPFFSSKKSGLAFILVVFSLLELALFNARNLPRQTTNQLISSLKKDFPFVQEIKREEKIFFLDPKPSANILPLEANNNILWQIKSFNSNFGGTKRFQRLLYLIYHEIEFDIEKNKLFVSSRGQKLLALQSVKYLVTSVEVTNLKLMSKQSGFNFYEIPSPVPEKRTVNHLIFAETQKELIDLLLSKELDASNSAILEEQPPSNQAVMISQSFLPGWKARFNHQIVIDVLPANLNQQAIPLIGEISGEPSLFFFPQSLKTGAIISLTTLGFCLFFRLLLKS